MDIYQDEVRREAVAINREHRAVMGRWKALLGHVFDPEQRAKVPAAQKAAILGIPSRRQFLRVGGLTIAGSAILVACGDDGDDSASSSTGGASTTEGAGGSTTDTTMAATVTETDLTLLRTAQSIEVLAINAYQAAIDSGLVTTAAIADAATLFQAQHMDHTAALGATTTNAGGEEYDEANPYLQENVIDPALASPDLDEVAIVALALDLENVAAQTYALAGGVLSTPTLRQTIMSIGGVEARHAAVLYGVLDGAGVAQVPDPFMPTDGAAPEESWVS